MEGTPSAASEVLLVSTGKQADEAALTIINRNSCHDCSAIIPNIQRLAENFQGVNSKNLCLSRWNKSL